MLASSGKWIGAVVLALAFGLQTGCVTMEPYAVKVSGEVLVAAKDAPRELKSGIYTSTQVDEVRKLSGGKVAAADRAVVTLHLQFGEKRYVSHVLQLSPANTKDGKFAFETRSDGFDRLGEIKVTVEAPGKQAELRRFTTPQGVTFEDSFLVVLEDPSPVAPPNPLEAPTNTAAPPKK